MRPQLTQRQKEVLEFIKEFTSDNAYPPTMREICGRFGFQPRAATNHVDALAAHLEIADQRRACFTTTHYFSSGETPWDTTMALSNGRINLILNRIHGLPFPMRRTSAIIFKVL